MEKECKTLNYYKFPSFFSFLDLISKMNKLNDYLNAKMFIKPKNGFSDSSNNKTRISIMDLKKFFHNYGHSQKFNYDDFSSGEESGMEAEKLNESSVRDVYKNLNDDRTIMIVVKIFSNL